MIRNWVGVLSIVLWSSSVSGSLDERIIARSWSGVWDDGILQTTVVLHTPPGPNLLGKISFLEQGILDMPTHIELQGNAILLTVEDLDIVYEGVLEENGTTICGHLMQKGTSISLMLKDSNSR